ncbi:hypothetical protein R6Z07F_018077 [Ovis aries]
MSRSASGPADAQRGTREMLPWKSWGGSQNLSAGGLIILLGFPGPRGLHVGLFLLTYVRTGPGTWPSSRWSGHTGACRTLAESSLDLTRAVTALNAIGTPALRMSRNEDVEEALREGVRGPEALGPLCPGNGFRSHRCGALGQAREAAPAPAAAATVGLEPLLGLGLGADGPCQEAAGRLTLWISLCCWCRHPKELQAGHSDGFSLL